MTGWSTCIYERRPVSSNHLCKADTAHATYGCGRAFQVLVLEANLSKNQALGLRPLFSLSTPSAVLTSLQYTIVAEAAVLSTISLARLRTRAASEKQNLFWLARNWAFSTFPLRKTPLPAGIGIQLMICLDMAPDSFRCQLKTRLLCPGM